MTDESIPDPVPETMRIVFPDGVVVAHEEGSRWPPIVQVRVHVNGVVRDVTLTPTAAQAFVDDITRKCSPRVDW